MTACKKILTECLTVGDRVPVVVDFSWVAANKWNRGAIYSVGDKIRTQKPGFQYECTIGGQAGHREPNWPRNLDQTVDDGSVTWTAKAVAVDSLLKVLTGVNWTPPTGVTISGNSFDSTNQTAIAYIETTAVGTYEISVRPTFDDIPAQTEGYIIEIEVE